ncbi:MAG: TlyA family RNA methyltransferase [Candidatus Adiutrix sp.]
MLKKEKTEKSRADSLLVASGLAKSRTQAQAFIMAGEVFTGGGLVKKAGEMLPLGTTFELKQRRRFVSRGGDKLNGALADLNVNPQGLTAMDVGASTGGFTDCLLQHGALSVTAIDVGRNLLDWTLRSDRRVTVVEGVNARDLSQLPPNRFDLAVVDVSFISLALIIPQIAPFIKDEGRILAMVKPQFEVGREKVGKKGVVRDLEFIQEAVEKIKALAPNLGFEVLGQALSQLLGPAGNQEVFVLFGRKQ